MSTLCPEVTVIVLSPHRHDSTHFTLRTRHSSDTFHQPRDDNKLELFYFVFCCIFSHRVLRRLCDTSAPALRFTSSSIAVLPSFSTHRVWVFTPSPQVTLQGEPPTMTSTGTLSSSSGSAEVRGWKRRRRRRRRRRWSLAVTLGISMSDGKSAGNKSLSTHCTKHEDDFWQFVLSEIVIFQPPVGLTCTTSNTSHDTRLLQGLKVQLKLMRKSKFTHCRCKIEVKHKESVQDGVQTAFSVDHLVYFNSNFVLWRPEFQAAGFLLLWGEMHQTYIKDQNF